MAKLQVDVSEPNGLREAADRLRREDKSLPGELRNVLRKVVRPIVAEQKSNIRSLSVGQSSSTGLRRMIASGVKLRVRTGRGRGKTSPGIRILTSVPGTRGLAALPRGMDTYFGGWRAPLFGNRSQWYHHQMSGGSWFMGPPTKHRARIEAEIKNVLAMSAEGIANYINTHK